MDTQFRYNSSKDFLSEILVNNPHLKLKKAVQALGLRILLDEIGVRDFREITKQFGHKNWYRLNCEMSLLKYPKAMDIFMPLRKVISDFKPLKLIDFQENELNNVNIS